MKSLTTYMECSISSWLWESQSNVDSSPLVFTTVVQTTERVQGVYYSESTLGIVLRKRGRTKTNANI